MTEGKYRVIENIPLTRDVFKMTLAGKTDAITAPGQFVNIKLEGLFLRRPISVSSWTEDSVTLIYKVVGVGTEQLSKLECGAELDLLVGLGNGYSLDKSGEKPLLIGGGVGVPPLFGLAQRLIGQGKSVTVILGFNTAEEMFYKEEFEKLGARVLVSTVDGTAGVQGFVTKCMEGLDYTYYYACGPKPMLRAVWEASAVPGQLSFEERMGCGFGACMGCTCQTKNGPKRVCKEGPVFESGEVIW